MLSNKNHLLKYLVELDRKYPRPTISTGYSYEIAPEDLEASDTTLKSLLTELSCVEEVTSELKSRISSHRAYQQSGVSPIGRLPNEVLAHIFQFVIGEHINLASDSFWNVQCVCTRWRSDIIQNTPFLWRKFEINEDSWRYNGTIILYRLYLCLQHSQSALLDIIIRPPRGMREHIFPLWAMESVAQHCDCWESFEVQWEFFDEATRDTRMTDIITQKGVLKLRKLDINALDDFPGHCQDVPFHIFQSAVLLEELHLQGTTIPNVASLPLKNIRKLDVSSGDDSHPNNILHSLLLSMPLLEELDWGCCYGNGNWIHFPEISLLSLHTLSVERWVEDDDMKVCEDSDDNPLLPPLRVPNLTNLKVYGNIIEANSLFLMIRKSGSTVTNLKINDVSFTFAKRLFQELQHVENLEISDCKDVLELLLAETHIFEDHAEDVILLPCLQNLTYYSWKHNISQTTNVNALTMSILNVIRSRSSSSYLCKNKKIPPLLHVRIGGSFYDKNNESLIRQLGNELGIEIHVGWLL